MTKRHKVLSEEQAQHFLKRGYVVIKQVLPGDFAAEQVRRMWVRLGYDPGDRPACSRERIHMDLRDRHPQVRLT